MGAKGTGDRKIKTKPDPPPLRASQGRREKVTAPESYARLKAMLDALPDTLFVVDRQGRICDYHAPDPDRLYVPPEQFLGRKIQDVLPEPAAGIVRQAIASAAAHGHHRGSVYALPHFEGEHWYELSIAAQGDPRAKDARFVAIVRDITGRRKAEEALRESEQTYRMMTEGMKDVIWILDVEARRFLYVSPSVKKLRGYTAAEILARPIEEAWAPEQREELDRLMRGYIADFLAGKLTSGDYVTLNILQPCKDGSQTPSEIVCRLLRNERTGHLELHGVTRDISERKRAEAALRESEARFDQVARQSRAFVWEVDAQGLYMFATPVVEDLLGYRPDEIVGRRHIHDLHPEEGREAFREAVDGVMRRHGEFHGYENPLVTRDGRIVWVSTSAFPLLDQNGALLGYRGVDLDITGRKQAEDALRESEARLRAIHDNLPDGLIYQIDSGADGLQRRFTSLSRGVERMHGITSEQAMEDPLAIYGQVIEEDRIRVAAQEVRAASTLTPLQAEVRVRLPSGEIRWRLFTSAPRRLPNGHLVWDGIELDITERKQAEEALKQSEAKYRYLHESMRDAFATADMKGRIQDFNPAFRDLLGYADEDLLNMPYRQLTPRKWQVSEAKILREQVMARGYSDVYEKEYVRKNGTLVPVELRTILIRDAQGEPAGMWASIRDISERKRAEQALKEARDELERRVEKRTAELEASRQSLAQSEEQFRQMAENVQDAFWLIDARTQDVLYASPAFEQIWKQPAGDKVARWFARIHPDDRERVAQAFQAGMKTGIPDSVTYRLLWPDGSIRWIESSGTMIRDARGRPMRAAGLHRDITERRHMEEEILKAAEAERQRIGRDLHDSLGQSLTAIGYLAEALRGDLARQNRPEAGEARKLGRLIEQAADQSHALARGLLLADLKRGGLAAALQQLASRTRELLGAPCRYAGPAEIPPLAATTAGQLYRIAQEAVTNAAKHGKGAPIEIRLENGPEGLRLSVHDAGKGISPKKRKSFGMGLDIRRYRANLVGAALWIDSLRGQGTTVNCLLPRPARIQEKPR